MYLILQVTAIKLYPTSSYFVWYAAVTNAGPALLGKNWPATLAEITRLVITDTDKA